MDGAKVIKVWVLANPTAERVVMQTIQGTMLTAPNLGSACTFPTADDADRVKFVHGDLTHGYYAYEVPAALFIGREYREAEDYVRIARTRPRAADGGADRVDPHRDGGQKA